MSTIKEHISNDKKLINDLNEDLAYFDAMEVLYPLQRLEMQKAGPGYVNALETIIAYTAKKKKQALTFKETLEKEIELLENAIGDLNNGI